MSDPHAELVDLAGSLTYDPLTWSVKAYDWGYGELADYAGPRLWQRDVLGAIRDHLSDEATRFQPFRAAVASGHGIGKSALIGMISNWGLSTCEDTRIIITANTDTQLRTKTSPEVGKWSRMSLTDSWFSVQSTSIASMEKGREKAWRADFVPWSEHNTEAFAGLHNKGKRIILIFDEASAIADKVWEVAEGALTDEGTEIIWIAFGNPTRNTGRFRECFRRFKHRWWTRQIDSRTVEGVNREELDRMVTDYGEDSDLVKVRVRGMFPSMSSRQFIADVDVAAAYGKGLNAGQYNFAPKIISVDPAWEGDDEFVIAIRQGLAFRILEKFAKNDNDLIAAAKVARWESEEQADAVFIDAGYGTGIVSAGQGMGRDWVLVWFAGESSDPGCLNKRAQMWKDMRDWLKAGGAIPADPTLRDELQAPETVPRIDGKIQIEAKKDMKARGVPSPNRADALALTFAFPVAKRSPLDALRTKQPRGEYDPYSRT